MASPSIAQGIPYLFSNVFDGRSMQHAAFRNLSKLDPKIITVGDIVVVGVIIERTHMADDKRPGPRWEWRKWDIQLKLKSIIQLFPVDKGAAMDVDSVV